MTSQKDWERCRGRPREDLSTGITTDDDDYNYNYNNANNYNASQAWLGFIGDVPEVLSHFSRESYVLPLS